MHGLPPTSPAILHVVLRPRYSGAEMLVKALIPLHAAQGCRTGFCALLASEPAFELELEKMRGAGCKVYVPAADLHGPRRIFQVAKAIRDFRPDLIVAHTVIPAAYTRAAAIMTGWRVFSREDHQLAIALHAAENDDYEKLAFRVPEWVLTYFADAVVTVSEESKANYRRRVRQHPGIRRIANGIDLHRFRAAASRRDEIRQRLGLGGHRLILQVGRLSIAKQQLFTLEALVPLLRQDPKRLLWFAGLPEEPDYEMRLRDAVEASGVSSQIQILGSRTDVPDLLAAADVYVMPSTMEAHSVALIEALASGVPVVASNIPTFQYAAALPGVKIVGMTDAAALATEAGGFLAEGGKRYARDLDRYDIATTERQYRELMNG